MKNRLDDINTKPQKPSDSNQVSRLQVSAGLNLLGDVGLMVEGLSGGKEKRNLFNASAGGLYTLGALTAALFGKINPKERFENVRLNLVEFLQSKTVETSETIQKLQKAEESRSMSDRTMRYLRKNSGQVMLWFYTLGAAVMFAGGVQQQIKTNKESTDKKIKIAPDLLVGGFSLLVKLTSAILPEGKEKQVDAESKGFWEELKSQPMKLFGYGSFLTEIFWGYSLLEKKKEEEAKGVEKKTWPWRAVTTGSYAASDIIIATAKKDSAHELGDLRVSELDELEEMAAESIAHQAPEKQAELTRQTAEFLEEQSGIERSKEELVASIERRMAQRKPRENWVVEANEAQPAEMAL